MRGICKGHLLRLAFFFCLFASMNWAILLDVRAFARPTTITTTSNTTNITFTMSTKCIYITLCSLLNNHLSKSFLSIHWRTSTRVKHSNNIACNCCMMSLNFVRLLFFLFFFFTCVFQVDFRTDNRFIWSLWSDKLVFFTYIVLSMFFLSTVSSESLIDKKWENRERKNNWIEIE